MKKKFVFNGCSLTVGEYLPIGSNNYGSLVADHYHADYENIAVPGTDNYHIFLKSLEYINQNSDCTLFVHWTWIDRIGIFVHPTNMIKCTFNTHYSVDEIFRRQEIQRLGLDKKELEIFLKYKILLTGRYKQFHDLFKYVDIIYQYSQHKNIQVVFINSGIDQFVTKFVQSDETTVSKMPNLLKDMFVLKTTPDATVQLYIESWKKIYHQTKNYWVNFDQPWNPKQWCDLATDNNHPGEKSHQVLALDIIEFLKIFKNVA